MSEKNYNIRGNPVANLIYDKLLAPEEKPSYDGPIPKKPEGLDELPPNINMTAAPIKNLSEMKQNTPEEQSKYDVLVNDPVSGASLIKEIDNLKEAAKELGVDVLEDDADLASQTPAGEASAGDILPGGDGWVNQTPTNTESVPDSDNKSNPNPNPNNEGPKDKKAKQESKYKLRSIMDAYNEGLLDEKSRDYLIVDALSKFARNTGKDLGNLAAAYTGGSMNNDRESSIWEERNKAMAGKAIGAEGNKLRSEDNYDLDYQSQKLDLAKKRIQMVPAQNFQKAAENLRNSGNETGAAIMDLIAAASTQGVDPEEYIAAAYANDPNVKQLVDNSMGALSSLTGILGDLAGYVEEIVKSAKGKAGDSANKSTARRVADTVFAGNPVYGAITNYMDNK